MQNFNDYYGWNNEDSILYDDLKRHLLETHGTTELKAYIDSTLQPVDSIETYIMNSWPAHVLDSIELFDTLINKVGKKVNFRKSMNTILKSEGSPLRLLENQIVKLDSEYLESEILNKAYELLENNQFEKASKDFLDARTSFTSGDFTGCVANCNNAIESSLKKILNKEKGEQGNLKKWLMKSGIIPEYFQGFIDHFEGILQSAVTIANKSARHGSSEIPKPPNNLDNALTSFILHLTGTILVFIIERYQENIEEEGDSDVPF